MLDGMTIEKVSISIVPVREHRFVAVFHGSDFSSALSDSDPQKEGVAPKTVAALSPEAARSARIANKFIAQARGALAGCEPANMVLLRGFAHYPDFPKMSEVFGLKPAAIAVYPMYRGLAKVVGMDIIPTGNKIEDQFDALVEHYGTYDFFFLHIKKTDSAGEDGDFTGKVKAIEEVDRAITKLTSLDPEVIVVTADHSTPAELKAHSWHSVPFLLYSKVCRSDDVPEFSERACIHGALGRFPSTEIMPLALANALKLKKYGA
jgi:2,3-bisphosphoglycerate-independent phosphoglycerate mutase